MKTARTWYPEDKPFLKKLSKLASRLIEEIEAPMMDYFPRVKVGRKLAAWREQITTVQKSIDRDIRRIK